MTCSSTACSFPVIELVVDSVGAVFMAPDADFSVSSLAEPEEVVVDDVDVVVDDVVVVSDSMAVPSKIDALMERTSKLSQGV